MSAIDLMILGKLWIQPKSAYDLQKEIAADPSAQWVKISAPSIYKKALRFAEQGYLVGTIVKEGKMPEKSIYTLTDLGREYFLDLMNDMSRKPVNIHLDLNAIILNLDQVPEDLRGIYLDNIRSSILHLKQDILSQLKSRTDLSSLGGSILNQQLGLVETLEQWIYSVA